MYRNRVYAPCVSSWIDQNTRVHHSLRIEFALGPTQRAGKKFRPLLVIKWPMEPAHGVMVGGRTAILDGCGRTGRQHLHELVEHHSLVKNAAKREVEAWPIWIDMSEAAGDGAL